MDFFSADVVPNSPSSNAPNDGQKTEINIFHTGGTQNKTGPNASNCDSKMDIDFLSAHVVPYTPPRNVPNNTDTKIEIDFFGGAISNTSNDHIVSNTPPANVPNINSSMEMDFLNGNVVPDSPPRNVSNADVAPSAAPANASNADIVPNAPPQHVPKLLIGPLEVGDFDSEREYDGFDDDEEEEERFPVLSVTSFEGSTHYAGCDQSKLSFQDGRNKITIRKVFAEGWIYKRGTGFDLFVSKRWKRRWAQLALLCGVPGFSGDMPSLLIYWGRSSTEPSSVVPLIRAVTMPVENKSQAHCHQFTIIPNGGLTRTFAAPMQQRDEWMHVIQVAMRDFEKRKAAKKEKKKQEGAQWQYPNES